MKLFLQSSFVLILLLQLVLGKCQQIVRRPEIRELTKDQRERFFNAIKVLNSDKGNNKFTGYSTIHNIYFNEIHFNPSFFPWHRAYLRMFEKDLQSIDSSIILPYWDWSLDSDDPTNSIILSDEYFGKNGDKDTHCVTSGPFANFMVNVPKRHCLKRDYNKGDKVTPFYPPESIEAIIASSKNYITFRNVIEYLPHSVIHTNIGGAVGDLSDFFSPNDPLFYMHHAFIDLLWHEWQLRNPSLANSYSGLKRLKPVSSNDILDGLNVTVATTLNTKGDGYCYEYKRYYANSKSIKAILGFIVVPTTEFFNFRVILAQINLVIKYITGELITIFKPRSGQKKIIPFVEPIPENRIVMKNMNVTYLRELEANYKQFIQLLNDLPDYKPI